MLASQRRESDGFAHRKGIWLSRSYASMNNGIVGQREADAAETAHSPSNPSLCVQWMTEPLPPLDFSHVQVHLREIHFIKALAASAAVLPCVRV
jgi:hypothetical protein